MPALKSDYKNYYESGSAARKRNYYEEVESYNSNRRYGKNKVRSVKSNSKSKKVVTVCGVLCAFCMTMVMSYRYNLINEKNLKTIELKSDLEAAQANLLNAQIAVEQSTNLTEVEAYAKQKLGMQKPDKNQIIYVDTSNVSSNISVSKNLNNTSSIFDNIKQKITNLF